MRIDRRDFVRLAGATLGGAAASAACSGERQPPSPPASGPSAATTASAPGSAAPRTGLSIEIGGLAAYEWWRADRRMDVHFLSGRHVTEDIPHQVVLTASIQTVKNANPPPNAVVAIPGTDAPYVAWVLNGLEIAVQGVKDKSLAVESQPIQGPCPAQPDDPAAWKSILWLPDFKEIFDSGLTAARPGAHLAGRLRLADGHVQCLMPADAGMRKNIYRFEHSGGRVPNFCRALTDRVLYEYDMPDQAVTLIFTPMPASTTKTGQIEFKYPPGSTHIALTLMSLPLSGRRSKAHFSMYSALVTDAKRPDAHPVFDRPCGEAAQPCGGQDASKEVGDPDHCYQPLMARP